MVLVDRTMDIGTIAYRGVPLAWQSPAGFRHPSLSGESVEPGSRFGQLFSGFLVTCGLEHIRQPAKGSPLHGRLPVTPARLTSYGEDWNRDHPVLFCEGEVVQATYGREAFRLCRRIESLVGTTSLRIIDRVENCGHSAATQAMLYHFNLGFPAVQTGTTVSLDEAIIAGPWTFGSEDAAPAAKCWPVRSGAPASCTIRSPAMDESLQMEVSFSSNTLPYLQIFEDRRSGILAIEPCTSDRANDGTSIGERQLGPRESREYQIEVTVLGSAPEWQRDLFRR